MSFGFALDVTHVVLFKIEESIFGEYTNIRLWCVYLIRAIGQATLLWVAVGFPMSGMDIPTVSPVGQRSVLG